jgi:iron complex outermembrane receptor protein
MVDGASNPQLIRKVNGTKGILMSRIKGFTGLACASTLAVPVLLSLPITGWSQIEEIVVTTRKRTESLQDVPISVDAFGSQQIELSGIDGLADIARFSPSMQFDNSYGPSDTRITIRGLSNTRGRSNVAYLVDGIDVTTENLIIPGSGLLANRRLLGDIERIEVVKGPQSALYGRAAFAGALSYITKEPGDEFEGTVRADVAEYGQYQFDAAFGGPVVGLEDVLGMRVNGVYWNEDGAYVNSISGDSVGGGNGYGMSWTTVWTPVDEVKIKSRLEYSDEEYDPRAAVRIGGGLPLESKPTADGSQQTDFPPGTVLTCEPGNTYHAYPADALAKGIGSAAQGFPFNGTTLGLADFGPGLCIPDSLGDGDGKLVRHSENPFTGEDYPGTETQTFRASLFGSLDVGFGIFSSNTGWTDFSATDYYDQDYQAVGRPDQLISHQQADGLSDTKQFTTEFRFQSDWEGPVQTAVGVLYWEESRKLVDRNVIVSCSPVGKVGATDAAPTLPIAGICDGTNGTVGPTEVWQDVYRSLPIKGEDYIRGVEWKADTEHWSVYGAVDWEFAEDWKVTVEDRFVDEDFTLFKPNHSSCTTTGFAVPEGQVVGNNPIRAETDATDVVCESERVLSSGIGQVSVQAGDDWAYIQGSQSSSFHTPKVTLEWTPTDDSLLYIYWAKAQKPGGISAVVGGGFPVPISEDRFEPEQLEAWELGNKVSFEAAGFMQLNTALFFQDYTDKQIGTQVLVEGQLQARIVNAAAAEVWGFEADWIWQPSFLEGLSVNLAYTYLNAEFVDFVQGSTSAQRAAGVGNCPDATAADIADGIDPNACAFDFSGNQMDRTPEHAAVGVFDYAAQVANSDFDWFTGLDVSWQDERFIDEENVIKVDAYWLLDARLGLQGGNWEAMVYIDNLLDQNTILTGGLGPDFGQQITETGFLAGFGVSEWFGVLPDPRTFGVRMSYNF